MKRAENLSEVQLADVGRLAVDAAIARRARLDAKATRNDAYAAWVDRGGDPKDEDAMREATAPEQLAYVKASRSAMAATQRLRRRLEALGVL